MVWPETKASCNRESQEAELLEGHGYFVESIVMPPL